jgi:hypothetical protein
MIAGQPTRLIVGFDTSGPASLVQEQPTPEIAAIAGSSSLVDELGRQRLRKAASA